MFSGGWKFNKSFSHLSSVKHLKGYSLKPWIVKVIEHDWLMAMALINLVNLLPNRRNGSFTTTNHMVFSVRNFRQIKSPILPEIWVNGLEKCIHFNWNKFEIKENDKRKFIIGFAISHNHSDKTTGFDWFHSLITFHRNKQQTEGKRRKNSDILLNILKWSNKSFASSILSTNDKNQPKKWALHCLAWFHSTKKFDIHFLHFILSVFFHSVYQTSAVSTEKNTSHTPLHIMLYSRNGRWRNVQISNDKCFRWEKMQSASDH